MTNPRQCTLVSVEDPSGNSQLAQEIIQQHAGQKLRLVHGNPSPSASADAVFELTSGRMTIIEL